MIASSPQVLLCSLVGDALSLGPHWVYDREKIATRLGRVTGFSDPISDYHPGKSAGDLTHYGDQAMVLARSLAEQRSFDLAHFAALWRSYWEDRTTTSYRDRATRETLAGLEKGESADAAASDSDELGGAARLAPLFLLDWKSEKALVAAARTQTAFTHGDPGVIDAAEFLVRLALRVRSGATMFNALESATEGLKSLPEGWLPAARETAGSDRDDGECLEELGLTCHLGDALPAVAHLLLRYPEDAAAALVANAEAGGDSAARGLALGLVYGARTGTASLPRQWIDDLKALPRVRALLDRMGLDWDK